MTATIYYIQMQAFPFERDLNISGCIDAYTAGRLDLNAFQYIIEFSLLEWPLDFDNVNGCVREKK